MKAIRSQTLGAVALAVSCVFTHLPTQADELVGANLQKRADAIIKGMLEHSQGYRGDVDEVDLNGLVERTVRLIQDVQPAGQADAVEVVLDLDPELGLAQLVEQSVGQALPELEA